MASSTTNPEVQLIRRAARGDTEAFSDLFSRHFQPVYNYALSLSQDEAQAEDLTQEAFLRAHAKLGSLGPPWNFRAWIFRLTHNLFIDQVRKAKTITSLETVEEIPATGPVPEEKAMRMEDVGRVRLALEALPTRQREVLELREYYAFPYAEIAEITGMSLSNVKVQLHRARNRFQEAYGVRLFLDMPTQDCAEVSELLGTLQDGETSVDQADLVRLHLQTCEACQSRRDRLQALTAGLLALPFLDPPSALAAEILKQVDKLPKPAGNGGQSPVDGGPGGARPGAHGLSGGVKGLASLSSNARWALGAGAALAGLVAITALLAAGFAVFQSSPPNSASPDDPAAPAATRGPASIAAAAGTEVPLLVVATKTHDPNPTPTSTFTATFTPTAVTLTSTGTAAPTPSETPLPLGSISGVVWNDINGNSVREGFEPGFAGVRINKFNGGCGGGFGFALQTTTNSNGNYTFSGLGAGTYCLTISQGELPLSSDGWDPTHPDLPMGSNGSAEINLGVGENRIQDFGFEKVTIS